MNLFARIMSHGFGLAVVALLAIGLIYRGELFPGMELPAFLQVDRPAKDSREATAETDSREAVVETGSDDQPAQAVVVDPVVEDSDAMSTGGVSDTASGAARSMLEPAQSARPAVVPPEESPPPAEAPPATMPPPPAPGLTDAETTTGMPVPVIETPDTEMQITREPNVVEPPASAGIDGSLPGTDAPVDSMPPVAVPVMPPADAPVTVQQDDEVVWTDSLQPSGAQPSAQDSADAAAPPADMAVAPALASAPAVAETESPYKLLAAAREAYWLRDYATAEQKYQAMIDLDPQNPDGYGELGNMYFSQGKWDRAAEVYFEAGKRLADEGLYTESRQLVDVLRGLQGPQADELEQYIATKAGENQ